MRWPENGHVTADEDYRLIWRLGGMTHGACTEAV